MKSLISRSKISRTVKRGSAIYEKIKDKYEPRHKGEYLVIEPDTKKVYLAKDGAQALTKARQAQPDKFFYLVKIGYDAADMMLNSMSIR